MIELRHLRYAVTVAEEGHLTRAAERLGLQQPPLSQQIKALETLVGVTLFIRQPRGMALTEAGVAFIARARQILADVDMAVEAAQRRRAAKSASLPSALPPRQSFIRWCPASCGPCGSPRRR